MLFRSAKWTASSGIWNRVPDSISNDDYITLNVTYDGYITLSVPYYGYIILSVSYDDCITLSVLIGLWEGNKYNLNYWAYIVT